VLGIAKCINSSNHANETERIDHAISHGFAKKKKILNPPLAKVRVGFEEWNGARMDRVEEVGQ
jgi:hypothetical protein